jgi:hypothetical protein
MKVRPASSFMDLEESMKHVLEIADWAALVAFLEKEYVRWKPDSVVTIEKYGGFDERIGWDTHLVCVDGRAALYTDGPMEKPEEGEVTIDWPATAAAYAERIHVLERIAIADQQSYRELQVENANLKFRLSMAESNNPDSVLSKHNAMLMACETRDRLKAELEKEQRLTRFQVQTVKDELAQAESERDTARADSESWRLGFVSWQRWVSLLLARLGLQPEGSELGDAPARAAIEQRLAETAALQAKVARAVALLELCWKEQRAPLYAELKVLEALR